MGKETVCTYIAFVWKGKEIGGDKGELVGVGGWK